ncbi:MAG TPA: TlpA disulfide reductase family protein, partial [Cytophagaceae bacterium]
YLEGLENQAWKVIDSSVVGEDSVFTIKGKVSEPDFFRLRFNYNQQLILILENTTISVSGDARDTEGSLVVEGSKFTNDYLSFTKKMSAINKQHEVLQKQAEALNQAGKRKELDAKIEELRKLEQYNDEFVVKYIDSIMPSYAIFSMINFINPQTQLDQLVAIGERMKKEMPQYKYTQMLTAEIEKMKVMREENELREKNSPVAVNKIAPDFTLKNPEGKEISLSSLRGKYVLIDFWASWCGPCRAENPNVVRMYNKYKDKDFEILGVSLDQDRKAWLKAIEKDQLTWKHVSDLGGWQSSVVPLYQINGIPATFLLDKEGRIIAKNLRGKALEDKLEELF